MKKTYVIVTSDRRCIAENVTREQINRLRGMTEDGRAIGKTTTGELVFGPRQIRVDRKRDHVWISLVDPAVIRAELKRDFGCDFRGAEDNYTTSKEPVNSDTHSGWIYQHNFRASHFATSAHRPAKTFDAGIRRIRITVESKGWTPLCPTVRAAAI